MPSTKQPFPPMPYPYPIAAPHRAFYSTHGYLVLHNFYTPGETAWLQHWVNEVGQFPREAAPFLQATPYLQYDELLVRHDGTKSQVLCRTENFASGHLQLNGLLRGEMLGCVTEQLAGNGRKMVLFKDYINFRWPFASGYVPHIDRAGEAFKDPTQITICIAVDSATLESGCMELVPGSHRQTIPLFEGSNCLDLEWVQSRKWVPVQLPAGSILVFNPNIAHRSSTNYSAFSRRTIFASYNLASNGYHHQKYYAEKAAMYPSTHMRIPGVDYSDGANRFALGTSLFVLEEDDDVDGDWREDWTKRSQIVQGRENS